MENKELVNILQLYHIKLKDFWKARHKLRLSNEKDRTIQYALLALSSHIEYFDEINFEVRPKVNDPFQESFPKLAFKSRNMNSHWGKPFVLVPLTSSLRSGLNPS